MKTNSTYSKPRKLLMIIIGVLMVVYALANSINDETINLDSYHNFSTENNIKDYVGVDQDKLEQMYESLIEHIQTGNNDVLTPYFNQKEILHMEDVHNLYNISFTLDIILIIMIIVMFTYYITINAKASKNLSKENILKIYNGVQDLTIIRKTIIITILISLIIVAIGVINFNYLFTKFHEIFFNNDLWLLDPKTDIMIRMLPEEYFYQKASGIFFRFITTIGLYLIMFTALKSFMKKHS